MKISFIGTGSMGSAVAKAILNSGRIKPCDIYVYDIEVQRTNELCSLGVNKCQNLKEILVASENILLAVRPQDFEELLCDIKSADVCLNGKTFISIAAAVSCDYICEILGCDLPVIRVMPNTPVAIGMGAVAVSRNRFVPDKAYSKICTLFASCGYVSSVDEQLMNKVISVNGSSPVFLYMLAKAMIEKAVEYGFSDKNAAELVYNTLRGSAQLLMKSEMTPDELIYEVCSPGGITEKAVSSLVDDGFYKIVSSAMDACTDRANELSK